ncbi:MAG: lytic murein transglycosylase B, partial [Gammaproteobacteria bacterium]|nr:lytic murein transglycosylase B [Gammaproteobacteria bacterium]
MALSAALWLVQAAPAFTLDAQQLDAFVADVSARHAFSADELRAVFASASGKQSIIDAITRPAERKPWHEYRKIFLTGKRIDGGVKFWRKHADILERARQRWGVAPEVIVAIIGVETLYGGNTGSYRVIDALSTLAFHYPK